MEDEGRSAAASPPPLPLADPASRRWVQWLRPGHPRRDEAVATLHAGLRRAAPHELRRRRRQLTALSGPEFDEVAQQCADEAIVNMTALRRLDDLLRAEEGDAGCDACVPILDQCVDLELRGEDRAARFPGTAIHLRVCPGCRADHVGLLEPARRFGDLDPEAPA